jgi:hypothetical protein
MRHRRVVVPRSGGPEVITSIEEDIPTPNSGEVRVKVLSAGVSLPDILAREGVHPETPRDARCEDWTRRKELLFPDTGIVVRDLRIPPDTRLVGSSP